MLEIIKNILFKEKYNYVPPCPRCKSYHTGYIMDAQTTQNNERIKVKRMQHGEIVQIYSHYNIDYNLFCEKCGLQWQGEIIRKYVTEEEIEMEKERRGITEDYIYDRNFTKQNIRKRVKRIYREEKRKNIDPSDHPNNKKTKKKNEKNVKIKK